MCYKSEEISNSAQKPKVMMFVDVKYTTAFADYSGDLAKRDVC